MKNVFLALAILISGSMLAQEGQINWMSIEEAQEAQKKDPKKIMIDVYTKWCGPCKMLDKNTFSNKDVANYVNTNYYAVKFDAESPDDVVFKGETFSNPTYDPNKKGRNGVNELSRTLGVRAYPTIVFMDEDLNIITPLSGYRAPRDLEVYLKFFANDEYKSVTTKEEWEVWQASFSPTFTN